MRTVEYRLAALAREDCEEIRLWRNQQRESLRTPFLFTLEMQEDFYQRIVCNREARDRYWAVRRVKDGILVAMTGLTGIQWENGLAEISLIIGPSFRRQGVGLAAVRLVLEEAFGKMRLLTVCGEVYECNKDAGVFWDKVTALAGGSSVRLPRRKWWDGKLWNSVYFTIWQAIP